MVFLNLIIHYLQKVYLSLHTKFSISSSFNSRDHRAHTDTRTRNMALSTWKLLVYIF